MMKPRDEILMIAATIGVEIPSDWSRIDDLFPLLHRMREEKAVVLLKIDGLRERCQYTAVVQGGPLGKDEFYRLDADTCEEAICSIIVWYAERVWSPTPA